MVKFLRILGLAFLAIIPSALLAQSQEESQLLADYLNKKYPRVSANTDAGWVVTDYVKNAKNGVTHMYVRQTFGDTEIINANLSIAIANGQVVHSTGRVKENFINLKPQGAGSINHHDALEIAGRFAGVSLASQRMEVINSASHGNLTTYSHSALSTESIPVKNVYWLNEQNELVPAIDLSISPPGQSDWWSLRINALTGEIVEEGNWVVKCSFDHDETTSVAHHTAVSNEVTVSASSEEYFVFPVPFESPNHGAQTLVVSPYDATASPFGWHDTNGISGAEFQITRGNNVYAYEDKAASNTAGFSPSGGASLSFNAQYFNDGNPDNSLNASIINLFYWNNIIHDILYQYGFDEQSGNFQQNNYGKGGNGNDFVQAEDADGSGTNNANFGTPPDGQKPRMQMYIWSNGGFLELQINSPAEAAGSYSAGPAQFGAKLNSGGITANFVLAYDNDATNPNQCCGAIVNSSEVAGKIAVIDRGSCSFAQKVKNAELAGAIGVIVINTQADETISMAADQGGIAATVNIPSICVSLSTGNIIKNHIANINGTMRDSRLFVSSSFDNGIIVHEYGHGVSNRLTGGPANADCLINAEQMGEGWSDYLAMMLTIRDTHTATGSRGVGTFAKGETISGRGIRPAPYSTDMAVNPFTYKDVANNAISQPHGIGFIWATMLYDMTWLFIDRYGFDDDLYYGEGGNNIALQLVMDGMKLQPCSPGFVDGRDAILLADRLNNNGANQDIIWQAFARRGLGASASQGSSADRFDGVEAFDLPKAITIDAKIASGLHEVGTEMDVSVKIANSYAAVQNEVTIAGTIPENLTVIEESLPENAAFEGGVVSMSVSTLNSVEETQFSFRVLAPVELSTTNVIFSDNQENGDGHWTKNALFGTNNWARTSHSPYRGEKSWRVQNIPTRSDQVLTLTIPHAIPENAKLAVWHRFNTEGGYDGGVMEVSIDNGSWIDLGNKITENGYTSNITSNNYNRNAFTGNSKGYQKSVIDLSTMANQNIKVRFRFLSDDFVGGEGWFVDDIYLYTGEESSISLEFCVTSAESPDSACGTAETTLVNNQINCQPFSGNILFSNFSPGEERKFCTESFDDLVFSTSYSTNSQNPGESYESAYILTLSPSPYTVQYFSLDGSFLNSEIAAGDYTYWGINYNTSNAQSLADYLGDITNLNEINTAIANGDICADVTSAATNGIANTFTKLEQCVLSSNELNGLVKLYPNPTSAGVSVQLNNQNGKSAQIKVYDMAGNQLLTESIAIDSPSYTHDLKKFAKAGMYILQITIDENVHTTKVVVEE